MLQNCEQNGEEEEGKKCKMQQSIINLIVGYCGYDIHVTDTIDCVCVCASIMFTDLVSFSHRFN